MTNEECFDAWAPEGAVWSLWAKPVLFAQRLAVTPPGSPSSLPEAREYLWLSQGTSRTAVVVDLPGVESVTTGLALARRWYRPVPLYNTSDGPSPLVNVAPIVEALASVALALQGMTLQPDAPPAFLLDANRMTPLVPSSPGKYDNRWLVFPQDLPSGTFLRGRGVAEVVVLHDARGVQEDLAHVLLRWQQAGVRILAAGPADTAPKEHLVKAPSWFRGVAYRLIALAGLRRNNAGGFGGVIPTPGAGHG